MNEGGEILEREQRKRKRGEGMAPVGGARSQHQDLSVEDLRYKPRTPATRATYELITTIVGRNLGDVPTVVTRSAADAVLEYLKDDSLKDFDKKKEVDDIIGLSMGAKEFNELVSLSKKITDYDAQDEDEDMGEDGADGADADVDENQGVAVVFDEDEDDEDAGQTYEVRDEDTSEEEDGAAEMPDVADSDNDAAQADGIADAEEIVIQGNTSASVISKEAADRLIPAHEIDA
jgi:pre-mRNA-splicing helicase BRR2